MSALPCTANPRAAYQAKRHAARSKADTREDRGLPHHPENGLIDCPDCEGAGEHTHNDTNPHGYGPDPQCDYGVSCERCTGTGSLADGRIDPMLDLHRARWAITHLRGPFLQVEYRSARRKALGGAPLAQLRMVEAAIRCDVASREALAAWRVAA